jgi:hypothetical protein
MKKLVLISVIILKHSFLFSQCEFSIEFNEVKKDLDSSDLFFRGKDKFHILAITFYNDQKMNETEVYLMNTRKKINYSVDTVFNLDGNVEIIIRNYFIKKTKPMNIPCVIIYSKDICVEKLIIPIYTSYDFIDLNFHHKYVIYRNRILVNE